jgi:hypothetical protein
LYNAKTQSASNTSTVFSLDAKRHRFSGLTGVYTSQELRCSTVEMEKEFKKLPPEFQQEAIRNSGVIYKHAWSWRTVKIMVEPKTLLI